MNQATDRFPNAKKDQDFYLEIWRHNLCGFSNRQIAKGMGTSAPTVRRVLNKIRAVDAPKVYILLANSAQTNQVPSFLAYDHFIATMSKFYHGGQTVAFSDYFSCLTKCDLRGHPRAFINKHIRLHSVQFQGYELQFIEYLDLEAAKADFDKFRSCRYCPLKAYKNSVMSTFQSDLHLYAYIMQELASIRKRKLSDHALMKLCFEAGTTFIIHEIVLRAGQKAALHGQSSTEALEAMERAFLDLTQQLWSEILVAAK